MQRWMLVTVSCALLSACVSGNGVSRGDRPDRAIGWLHGNCLALEDASARVGQEVAVVMLGEEQQVMTAQVTGTANDGGECIALTDDRRDTNLRNGLTFYKIGADAQVELGIGVVQAGGSRALTVSELLDTNGDGRRDSFSHCTTSEGVQFSVWTDEARSGAPMWTGYYYLGYDIEANCPEDR